VRQGRQLLDLDVADDLQLLDYMFVCIRAGQIDEVGTWFDALTLGSLHTVCELLT